MDHIYLVLLWFIRGEHQKIAVKCWHLRMIELLCLYTELLFSHNIFIPKFHVPIYVISF
jgi:hypothetical protein